MDKDTGYSWKKIMVDALAVGLLGGLLSTFYRYLVAQIGGLRNLLYGQLSPQNFFLALVLALVVSLVIHWLLKLAPLSGGSGIPQIRGELLGYFEMEAEVTVVSKLVGGALGNLMGFSLGREGPSIQMGGAGGKILAKLFHRNDEERKNLIAMGAAAGLSAAFNAPLAGCIFVMEELYKSYTHKIILPALLASCTANAVSFLLMGQATAFSFAASHSLPIYWLFIPVLIGCLTGLVGAFYNKLILAFQDLYKQMGSPVYKYGVLMGVSVLLGFCFLEMTAGGHPLLEQMAEAEMPVKTLLLILLIKLLYTTFCYGSGVQGGIFLPVLVIGGACGALVYWALGPVMDLDPYYMNFVILGMSGILSSVVRSPLLSIVLVSEMTSTYKHVWALALVVLVSYYVAEGLKSTPIYDSLLDRMVQNKSSKCGP